jgi:hypothetical protein
MSQRASFANIMPFANRLHVSEERLCSRNFYRQRCNVRALLQPRSRVEHAFTLMMKGSVHATHAGESR